MKFSFLLLLITGLFCINSFAQSDSKKNIISFAPIGLLNGINSTSSPIYKLSYERYLTKYIDFAISGRIREACHDDEFSFKFFFNDPYTNYNKYAIRSGILVHRGAQFIEPMIQYEYGNYSKKYWITTENEEGDQYDVDKQYNRKYNSVGMIVLLGFQNTTKYISFKYYIGVGIHYRVYNEDLYGVDKWGTEYDEHYDPPINSIYGETAMTLHTGFEIGFRF
jgi:hypothetical protein